MFTTVVKRIINSDTFRKYFFNTSWLLLEKIFRALLLATVGIYVARYLGPRDFGKLNYALSFIAIGAPIASLGLDQVIVKHLVNKRWSEENILGTSLILKLLASLAIYGFLTLIYYAFLKDEVLVGHLIIIVSIAMIFHVSNLIDFYFQAKVISKYGVFALSFSVIIASVLKVIFILQKKPLIFFAYAHLVEYFVLAMGYFVMAKYNKINFLKWNFKLSVAKAMLKESWPLTLSGVVIIIYMKIDQIMLKEMSSNLALGNYSAAVKISEFWYFIPIVISASIFPLLTKYFEKDQKLYLHHLKIVMGIFIWVSVILSLLVSGFGEQIIYLLFGAKYEFAHQALKIHIFAGIVVSASIIYDQRFVLINKTIISFKGAICGAATNIALNLYFIPRYGIVGAAWATLISYAVPPIAISLFWNHETAAIYIESIHYLFHPKRDHK